MKEESKKSKNSTSSSLTELEFQIAESLGITKFVKAEKERQEKVRLRAEKKIQLEKLREEREGKNYSSSPSSPSSSSLSKEPYSLIRIHTCKTCGSTYTYFYRMEWNQNLNMLTPQPYVDLSSFQGANFTPPINQKYPPKFCVSSERDLLLTKTINSNTEICENCERIISELSKEDLVKLVLDNRKREICMAEKIIELSKKI